MPAFPRDPAGYAAALKRVPFLRELDAVSLRELASAGRLIALEKGEDLFSEGDPCAGMFLLLSGRIKVYRASASGREQIIAIESAGSVVAELPLFDGEPYPASCTALEDSALLLVPRFAFESLLRSRPDLALGVLRIIGQRLRHLVMLVEEVSLLEVPQRLAKYLLARAESEGSAFTLDLSNQEIAARLGTVRELVSRNLHRFEQQGLIRIDGRKIHIEDFEALRERIEEA